MTGFWRIPIIEKHLLMAASLSQVNVKLKSYETGYIIVLISNTSMINNWLYINSFIPIKFCLFSYSMLIKGFSSLRN